MGLGAELVGGLTGAAGGGEARATQGNVAASASVRGADAYGASLDRVVIRRVDGLREERPSAVGRQAAEIERRVTYLPERLRTLEVDDEAGEAVLRTPPDDVREGRYFEARLRGGRQVEVRRYRVVGDESGREAVPTVLTREVLERLVDDLADILK